MIVALLLLPLLLTIMIVYSSAILVPPSFECVSESLDLSSIILS